MLKTRDFKVLYLYHDPHFTSPGLPISIVCECICMCAMYRCVLKGGEPKEGKYECQEPLPDPNFWPTV